MNDDTAPTGFLRIYALVALGFTVIGLSAVNVDSRGRGALATAD
jgi:hypothetical protein